MENITDNIQQYIIDNYLTKTKDELAAAISKTPRWIKHKLAALRKSGHISYKNGPPPEITLSESDWTPEIKSRIFELRRNQLKTGGQIIKILKEEFNFNVNLPVFTFWMQKFNCLGRTKQEWLDEFLPKSKAEEYLQNKFRMVDISQDLQKQYGVYISDDLILVHYQKLGLQSQKLWAISTVNAKANEFSKEWLKQNIENHDGLRILSEKMGVSRTLVQRRIKEEGLELIEHRIIWSRNLDKLRDLLFEAPYLEILEEDLHQMILGWLAGDGHLDSNGRFVVNHSIIQLDYLYLKTRVLKKNLTNIVTVPCLHFSESKKIRTLGGSEQLGISCPGLEKYIKYLNEDDSKNLDKIYSELSPLGWACYFMDDGFLYDSHNMAISLNTDFLEIYKDRYNFGGIIDRNLFINNIDSCYLIPGMAYKTSAETVGEYWKDKIPELFDISIKNDLNLCFVKPYSYEKTPSILMNAIEYYHTRGFPYYSISDEYLDREYFRLKLIDTNYLWKEINVLRNSNVGNNIFKHYMPHMAEVKYNGISPLETFNNFMLLHKVLEYSLDKKKSILPEIIHNNLIYFNGMVKGFSCGVAKAVVEKFSSIKGVIVDPYASWGGRLLGICSADRDYYGFEPWDKTFTALSVMKDHFNLDAHLLYSEFDPEKAPQSCDMVFTSPPYVDIEIYGRKFGLSDWKQLIKNIFYYAEMSLKSGGCLILNIPRNLKTMIPSTILTEVDPLYWYSSSRQRDLDKAQILYRWVKTI